MSDNFWEIYLRHARQTRYGSRQEFHTQCSGRWGHGSQFTKDKSEDDVFSQIDSGVNFYNYGLDEPFSSISLQADSSKHDLQTVLAVKNVDLKVAVNSKTHHTNKFVIASPSNSNPQLIVRRGQPFTIEIEFSKQYNPDTDDLRLVFETGHNPLAHNGTYVEFILSHEDKPKEWGAKIVSQQGKVIAIEVYTPPTCIVAAWVFRVDVVKKKDTEINVYRYVHKNPIYILFNPWCKDDTVFMPKEELLQEYILNDNGKIFCGIQKSITSRPWYFGQFEPCVLDVAMYLLDIHNVNFAVRGNPIHIARKVSEVLNDQYDDGVLFGKWFGDFSDGTLPTTWTGSVAILKKYWKNKRPVRYGQCWVFAALGTSVCRALGIPARCVTNFESGHDTDGSITLDILCDKNGDRIRHQGDSIWNFHVWNEVWMARPDLPPGYGGWQVLDPTPQERSNGIFRCGPMPVNAIKKGEVNLPYDGPFIFAEVNADKVYWKANKFGVMECVYVNENAIGNHISTKAPNSNEREDLTHLYKYTEDSPEERASVLKANLVGSSRRNFYKPKAHDVKFNIEQDSENTWIGGSFIFGLRMKNNSRENRSVSGRIVVSSMYYTGVIGEKLKSDPFKNIVLKPGEEKVHKVVVTQDEYDGLLKTGCILDVSILTHVEETGQHFARTENYRLRKPHLTVKCATRAFANKQMMIEVSFINPLKCSLTNCIVRVDGVSHPMKFPQPNVPPNGTFTASLPVVPGKLGQGEVIILFNSKQLEDINTCCQVLIQEA